MESGSRETDARGCKICRGLCAVPERPKLSFACQYPFSNLPASSRPVASLAEGFGRSGAEQPLGGHSQYDQQRAAYEAFVPNAPCTDRGAAAASVPTEDEVVMSGQGTSGWLVSDASCLVDLQHRMLKLKLFGLESAPRHLTAPDCVAARWIASTARSRHLFPQEW